MHDALLREIEAAFPSEPIPPGTPLTESEDEDSGTRFRGTVWRDHDAASIALMTHSLSFFAPAASVRCLPAYLRTALILPDSGVGDALVYRLLPPKGDVTRPSFVRWWSLLNETQREALCRTMAELVSPDDHDTAAMLVAHRRMKTQQ